jgi:hypothetical protein
VRTIPHRGDLLGQGLDSVGSQASLGQDLDPAGVVDPVLGRDRVPQRLDPRARGTPDDCP